VQVNLALQYPPHQKSAISDSVQYKNPILRKEGPPGPLIVYATAPGGVALDGEGRNGIFTKHLLGVLHDKDKSCLSLIDFEKIGFLSTLNLMALS